MVRLRLAGLRINPEANGGVALVHTTRPANGGRIVRMSKRLDEMSIRIRDRGEDACRTKSVRTKRETQSHVILLWLSALMS